MKLHERVAAAEAICGHTFTNKELIEAALTHPSAVEGKPVSSSYERLEFLGDSILGAIIATELFERYPDMDEGQLTRLKISLVSGHTLSIVSDALGISPLIVMGISEKGTGKRGMKSALENVYESIVGALYLDAGFDPTHDFVIRTLGPHISPALAVRSVSPKSRLQEAVQAKGKATPEYKLIGESGPAHTPTFTAVVFVDGLKVGRGQGPSKKAAESEAAQDALVRLGVDDAPLDADAEMHLR